MANKKVQLGNLVVNERNGKPSVSIALGKKAKKPEHAKYDFSVELIVRDNTGKVVAQQTDGYLNLQDPRTLADDILANGGKLTEEVEAKMRERALKVPSYIKYEVTMSPPQSKS